MALQLISTVSLRRGEVDAVRDLGCIPTRVNSNQDTATHNTTVLNTWAQDCTSMVTARKLVINDRIVVNDTILLPQVAGMHIHFGGGEQEYKTEAQFNTANNLAGHCPALIWVGDVGADSPPMIEIQGNGVILSGGVNLQGVLATSVINNDLLEPHSTKLPSLAVLIRGVGGGTGVPIGLGSGKVTVPDTMFICGFQRGIQFGSGREEDNADNCWFSRIFCSHVDNLICFANRQAVSNRFGHIRQFADGTSAEQRAFELIRIEEGGGKFTIDHVEINSGLVLRVLKSDWNTCQGILHNLSIDPANGTSYRLFDGTPSGGTDVETPYVFTISSMCNGTATRESSTTAGPMIKAYGRQNIQIRDGWFFEKINGESIELHDQTGYPSKPRFRPAVHFDSCFFDYQCDPDDLILSSSTGKRTYTWVNCKNTYGEVISDGNSTIA